METKKFIAGLFTDKKIANFIENDNLMDFAILSIQPENEAGKINFQTLTNFWKLENHSLNRDEQFLFEIFGMFRNPKNAIASLLKHLETGKPITEKTFSDQAKLTPKNFTDEQKKIRLFSTFFASLTEADRGKLATIAREHFYANGIDQTGFEFFFINGTNGTELKPGQFVRLKDTIGGFPILTVVYQASPEGYVSLLDTGGLLTLSYEASKLMQIVDEKDVPKEAKADLMKVYNTQKETDETDKITKLEIGAKLYQKSLEEKAKAEKKEADEAKKLADSTKEKATFEKMSLSSMDEVKDFVKKLNTAKLIPAHKKELSDKVAKVKETLSKKQSETTPAGKTTTSTRKRKSETAQETSTTKEKTPKAKIANNKAKAKTLDAIIEEDAKSADPIL